jgi:hypothetical protein
MRAADCRKLTSGCGEAEQRAPVARCGWRLGGNASAGGNSARAGPWGIFPNFLPGVNASAVGGLMSPQ